MEDISPKSRLTTTLLTIFLGVFGIHRLYLEKFRTGVVMMALGIAAFSILGTAFGVKFNSVDLPLPGTSDEIDLIESSMATAIVIFIALAIWSLVDLIITLSGNMKDREGRPVKEWSKP
jgi:hypothetical protein